MHDAAADHDSLRREDADHADDPEREVPSLEVPGPRVVELGRGRSRARLDRAARGQAFPAIAVVGTDTGKRVRVAIVRDPHVSELRVQQPVQELAADHAAAADAGADCDVAGGVESSRGSPAVLPERGRVYVRVEGDRYAEAALDLPPEVGLRPAGLRGRRDVAPGRRGGVSVEWAEGADPDCVDRPFAFEEGDRAVDRLSRSRRRQGRGRSEVFRTRADRAFPFRAAGLDAAVDRQPAPFVWAPHDLRTVSGPGSTTTWSRAGPRPWIRSSSSCVPSVPNV